MINSFPKIHSLYSLYRFSKRFVGRFVYGLYSLYTFLYFSRWNATGVCMYYPAPRKQTSATRRLQVQPRRRWPRIGVVASTVARPTLLVTPQTNQPARRTVASTAPSFATAHGPLHSHVRVACVYLSIGHCRSGTSACNQSCPRHPF